uniref:Uncharacterized protein n=1 Tax=Kalanchoe fedtschenkoi TaxID=63787 RepID=A0A7N0RFQ1_KALFE
MASPGAPMSVKQSLLDKGAQLMQSLKPIGQMQQHACTFAFHSHDMSRQIEAHHYVARVNQDILQCVVYDSDEPEARLIGMEYIVSDRIFETLDEDEQKLWHSHAYEVKSALWVSPRIPEVLAKLELANFTKIYGKFWCTWQIDRGDVLPLGVPSLMISAQAVDVAQVDQEKIMRRDDKYNMSIDALKQGRVEMAEPEWINPNADHWKQAGKGFVLEIEPTEMNAFAPFP